MPRYVMKGPSAKSRLTAAIATKVASKMATSRALPARFNTSKKRYVKNRKLSKNVSKFIETKYNPCREVNEQLPQPIQLGAIAYYEAYILGNSVPAGWDTNIIPIDGISTTQDTGGIADRIGNYIYLKKNHFSLEIDMKSAVSILQGTPLVEFRVVVTKQRRAVIPSGQTKTPQTSLFLELNNNPFGYQTGGTNGTDLLRQPLNKRDWYILHDKKFTLSSPPTVEPGSGPQPQTYSTFYRSNKKMVFNLPFYKKVRYAPPAGGSLFSNPTDIDYFWSVFIFARPVDKDTSALNWETNVRAVTTYNDV